MKQIDSTELKKRELLSQLWWLWSGVIGFVAGALSVFVPFYLHALADWDLADNTTFFPREFYQIVGFYSQIWLIGGFVGALLLLVVVGAFRVFKAK